MTAKNTDKVPVTDVLIIALHEDWIASKDKTFQRRHLAAAINASPELTALIAENARLRDALTDMRFAYQNKDVDCPHDFEIIALEKAKQALGE